MTDGLVVVLGRVALAIYATLLGVGGFVGYKKAGSKASFVAGFVSAVLALTALAYSFLVPARLAFWLGLILSILLLMVFVARFLRKRHFMPSGVLCLLSLAMAGIMLWAIVSLNDAPVENEPIAPAKKKNGETTWHFAGFIRSAVG